MKFQFTRFIVIAIVVLASLSAEKVFAQNVEVIKFPDLKEMIEEDNGGVKIINFWATWCKPCIKELPQFLELDSKSDDKQVEIILVSFDFVEQLESRLKPFIKKKNINSKVVLLDETDFNAFIDKVDPSWSGAIPATLMINYRTNTKRFLEQEFKEGELEVVYNQFTK